MLFVRRGLISNKRGGSGGSRVISNFTKVQTSHLLWQPSALGGNRTMQSPFLHLPKKTFVSSSDWPNREYTWTLSWKESLLICFKSCQGVSYFYRQNGNRMMTTLYYLTLPQHIRDSLGYKFMPVHSKKAFFPQFGPEQNILEQSFERRAYWFVLKATKVFSIPSQAE